VTFATIPRVTQDAHTRRNRRKSTLVTLAAKTFAMGMNTIKRHVHSIFARIAYVKMLPKWRKMMAAEKSFENRVKKWLALQGIYTAGTSSHKIVARMRGWFLKVWGGGMQKSGIPDMILCVNGIFVAIELKSPVGRASEIQKINITRINQSGGIGIILYPAGFENFKKIIKGVLACDGHIAALTALRNVHSNTGCDILTG